MRASMAMQPSSAAEGGFGQRIRGERSGLQRSCSVYKENTVNSVSGCWPLLLQWRYGSPCSSCSRIDRAGGSVLWIPGFSPGPSRCYIHSVDHGRVDFVWFGVTEGGQSGWPPNPQTMMRLYFMPEMMCVVP